MSSTLDGSSTLPSSVGSCKGEEEETDNWLLGHFFSLFPTAALVAEGSCVCVEGEGGRRVY